MDFFGGVNIAAISGRGAQAQEFGRNAYEGGVQ
jgi:hypothetical protein